ncbi:MAG TPA: hypothetical protein VGN72_10095 [Tepidisphaeraceae bacterium]|nr:hypothetical protein [Tepidisphaeraceae bacterium]
MKKYEVVHQGAGQYVQGNVISEEQIVANGTTVERWLRLGAVKEVDASTPLTHEANGAQPAQSLATQVALSTGTPLASRDPAEVATSGVQATQPAVTNPAPTAAERLQAARADLFRLEEEAAREQAQKLPAGDPPKVETVSTATTTTGTGNTGSTNPPADPPKAPFDPVIGGKPLSYYDGKSDDQIRADKTVEVGPERLKQIHAARKAREQAAK